MAKHDIVTYNSTTKGFETDLGDNNAEIKGTGDKIFSVESGSTEIFSVGIDNTSITLNSNLTASGDISSSLASTASFSRLEFTKISGDASQMTNVNEIGHVSGAAQVASRISGAFDAGFVIQGDLSGSATSTGSFAKVFANTYVGDASQMTNVNEAGHFSASAQMASDISGSHTSGFEYTGIISGSATSTGSFGRVDFTGTNISGDASQMTSVPVTTDTVSGSAQLAADISGSFNKGFLLDGTISGSMTSTASFHTVNATSYVVTNEPDINTPLQQLTTIISSSAQISTAISESFNKGFEFTGTISSSATTTGSFSRLDAIKLAGDGSQITDLPLTGIISSSAQLATQISGAFTSGFEIGGALTALQTLTASYVGVSGSAFAYAGNATTMSISSICGSDFDYRLADGITAGKIKGKTMNIVNFTPVESLLGGLIIGLAVAILYLMRGNYTGISGIYFNVISANKNGFVWKTYRGMASKEAQIDWKGKYSSFEGVSSQVPLKGSVKDTLFDLEKGIRSGLSYSGARSIKHFHSTAEFIKQSSAGATESGTHISHRKW